MDLFDKCKGRLANLATDLQQPMHSFQQQQQQQAPCTRFHQGILCPQEGVPRCELAGRAVPSTDAAMVPNSAGVCFHIALCRLYSVAVSMRVVYEAATAGCGR